MTNRVMLAVGLMAAALGTLAAEPLTVPSREGQAQQDVAPARASQASAKALERGRILERRGKLEGAHEQYEIARQLAPAHSEIGRQALEHLHYHLPLRRVHERIKVGDLAAAEVMLRELLAAHAQHAARRQQIDTMLRNLQVLRASQGAATGALDAGEVLKETRRVLEAFRRRHGRYPLNYRELNQALPPNQPPLEAFLIGHYRGTGAGYVLLLRSKADPNHTLTLQNTGLLR